MTSIEVMTFYFFDLFFFFRVNSTLGGDYMADKIMIENDILYWHNNHTNITYEEAQQISEKLHNLLDNNDLKALIVDNRSASKVWSTDFDKIWIDLMKYIPTRVDKAATICPNIINKLQLNYLSSKAGTQNTIQAFTVEEKKEIDDFLEFEINLK